jgi:hypothetical protein
VSTAASREKEERLRQSATASNLRDRHAIGSLGDTGLVGAKTGE